MATPKKNISTTKDGDDDLADVSPKELKHAANAGAQEKASPKTKAGPKDQVHPSSATFRQDVQYLAAGDLDQDPREPYPTGNPPDPKEEFFTIHGFYPGEGGKGGIAGAKDTPKPKGE